MLRKNKDYGRVLDSLDGVPREWYEGRPEEPTGVIQHLDVIQQVAFRGIERLIRSAEEKKDYFPFLMIRDRVEDLLKVRARAGRGKNAPDPTVLVPGGVYPLLEKWARVKERWRKDSPRRI